MQYNKKSKAWWVEYIHILICIVIMLVVIMYSSEDIVNKKSSAEYSIEVTREIVALKKSLAVDKVCYDKSHELWLVRDSLSGVWHIEFDRNLRFITLENNTDIFVPMNMNTIFLRKIFPNIQGLFCI